MKVYGDICNRVKNNILINAEQLFREKAVLATGAHDGNSSGTAVPQELKG